MFLRLKAILFFALSCSVWFPSTVFAQPAQQGTVDLTQFQQPASGVSEPENTSATQTSSPVMLLLVYCVFIIAASLLGGWLPSLIRLTHTRMQAMISFVGGLMLGIGVFHLMPHAAEFISIKDVAQWMMVGIVMMFVLIRLFHFHNHEPVSPASSTQSTCNHGHDHDHDGSPADTADQRTLSGESHTAAECHSHGHSHGMSWMGIALGLSLHTLIDGLALGVSVHVDSQKAVVPSLLGLGTFLAVLLHKPLDAVSISALMINSGWTRKTINLVNVGFALMCPVGALLFMMGLNQFSGIQREFLGTALAFAAGVFICISLSDLLPEMEFHAHNKVELTIALALGIALSWGLTLLESGHLHG